MNFAKKLRVFDIYTGKYRAFKYVAAIEQPRRFKLNTRAAEIEQ